MLTSFPSFRSVALVTASLAALATAGAGLAGCPSTTTVLTYTFTGIVVRASSLVVGYGCGTGEGQVYRYVAVVQHDNGAPPPGSDATLAAPDASPADASPAPLSAGPVTPGSATNDPDAGVWVNVYDCFTDGVFENLPAAPSGSQTFDVDIYAYDFNAYGNSGLPSSLGCPPAAAGQANGCGTNVPVDTTAATWTTHCTAVQQAGTPVLAVCDPLARNTGASDAGSAGDGGDAGDGALDDGATPADAGDADATDGAAGAADGGDAAASGGDAGAAADGAGSADASNDG